MDIGKRPDNGKGSDNGGIMGIWGNNGDIGGMEKGPSENRLIFRRLLIHGLGLLFHHGLFVISP